MEWDVQNSTALSAKIFTTLKSLAFICITVYIHLALHMKIKPWFYSLHFIGYTDKTVLERDILHPMSNILRLFLFYGKFLCRRHIHGIFLLNPVYREMGVPWLRGSWSVEISHNKSWFSGWGHSNTSAIPGGDRLGWCFRKLCEVAEVLWRVWYVLENIAKEVTCWATGNNHRLKHSFL